VQYPFDCISEFIFAETGVRKSDVILIPGASLCLASRKCIVRRPKCAQANRRAWGWVFVPFRASSSG
jgi:hypothetical protein